MFPARNRIIAALAAMTVVVEAGERSGSLVTARLAREIGRPVGAVPGRVTTPQAAGPNGLLAAGAAIVRGPQDVLDQLFGAGERTVRAPAPAAARRARAAAGRDRRGPRDGRARWRGRGSSPTGGSRPSRRSSSAGSSAAVPGAASGSRRDPIEICGNSCPKTRSHAWLRSLSCPTLTGPASICRLGFGRRRRHPGRPEGVRRLRGPRHDRDHRDHRPEHASASPRSTRSPRT